MNFYRDLGLKKENLYEILATTYALDEENNEIIPNMACMGIRIVDNDIIKISPYPNTTTYSNLKSNKFLAINFVNDVSLYALAALKEFPPDFKESQKDYYKYKEISENRVQPFLPAGLLCRLLPADLGRDLATQLAGDRAKEGSPPGDPLPTLCRSSWLFSSDPRKCFLIGCHHLGKNR